ncbi:YggS family pyridoxal phosphate-dependent enzyme [Niveispirillum lacus]|uniref:Pyridoxal phosphate homeostasis protein n=1 Tax=Niveispirillum lacus TaxID=1981099 RepID=A0A255Z4U3_9PROT|nr:YggS family pyridoxal phosphate-dependent enzyme [Niveispirillum lacus]OYQ36469.1 YggS family pyridoxal phosphate-dependent enzyme [Niveispirillum lacus]
MTDPVNDVAANLAEIKARINKAAAAAGRPPGAARLIAVSKVQPVEKMDAALAAGHRLFGENRVQEAKAKFPAARERYPDIELHLIGPLQTNKVKEAVALFDVIQTLDRPRLAAALAEEGRKRGRLPRLFVEVNVGAEPQKAGIPPSDLPAFLEECRAVHGLSIDGLMCIPPADQDPTPHFALLCDLAKRHGLAEVSMGMSGDYEQAVAQGATFVRVGTAIFGTRIKPATHG